MLNILLSRGAGRARRGLWRNSMAVTIMEMKEVPGIIDGRMSIAAMIEADDGHHRS